MRPPLPAPPRGALGPPAPVDALFSRRVLSAAVLAATIGFFGAGCASRGVPETLDPTVAASAVEGTAPSRPLHAVFDWEMLDGGSRFHGSGAARIEPPYRVRLDLFGPRGDGYLSAAAVGMEIRLPPAATDAPLPPAAMMWAALGVVSPPHEARLVGTRVTTAATELHYDVEGSRLRYTLVDGRLESAVWRGGGRQMGVDLSDARVGGLPRTAIFRDASAGMELKLNLERVDDAEPFPPEIWNPDE